MRIKLRRFGFSEKLFNIIQSYFNSHEFKVREENNPRPITRGVPQGSLLGSTVFNVYKNDILKSVNVQLAIYAHDTDITAQNTCSVNITQRLQRIASQGGLVDWKVEPLVMLGWCCSVTLGLSSVLGLHPFSTGSESSRALAVFYAALHRCSFTAAVAWVLYASISGIGGKLKGSSFFLECFFLLKEPKGTSNIYVILLRQWYRMPPKQEKL
ncbi:hypothetical protein TNCV_608141 [Trichonephila clavipes]|nr:hypothetical protein TNCV_608141 [Trichonephila clavipes]